MALFKKEVSVDDLIAKAQALSPDDKAKLMGSLTEVKEAKPQMQDEKSVEQVDEAKPEEAPVETAEEPVAEEETEEVAEEATAEEPGEVAEEAVDEAVAEPIEEPVQQPTAEEVNADEAKFGALSENVAKMQQQLEMLIEAFDKRPFGAGGGTPPIDEDNGKYVGPHEKQYFNKRR